MPNIITLFSNTKLEVGYEKLFFYRPREADEHLLPALKKTIEQLIAEDVSYFYVGGYGGFDRIAGTAVKQANKQHPGIVLNLVLPYHPAEHPIKAPAGYDGTYYPEGLEKVPRQYAIVRANKIMVDTTDWLIAYVWHGASNSRKLLASTVSLRKTVPSTYLFIIVPIVMYRFNN